MAKRSKYAGPCNLETAFAIFAGRWKPAILYQLTTSGTLRFGQLRRLIPEISQRIITANLRELERDGVVHRKQYAEVPPRVEYSLTKIGQSLEPLMRAVEQWSETHMKHVEKARLVYDKSRDSSSGD